VCFAKIVKCPAEDIMCTWSGTRHQLLFDHSKICPFLILADNLRDKQKRIEALEKQVATYAGLETRLIQLEKYLPAILLERDKEQKIRPSITTNLPLRYIASVSTPNCNTTFSWEGLTTGKQELLTSSSASDYILIDFGEEVILTSLIVQAPTIGGTDANRINGALFQRRTGGNWESVLVIEGVNNTNPKTFHFSPVTGKFFRLSHKDMQTCYCLGVKKLLFNEM